MSKLESFLNSYLTKIPEESKVVMKEEENPPQIPGDRAATSAQLPNIKGRVDESNLYVIKLPPSLKPFSKEIFQHLDNPVV